MVYGLRRGFSKGTAARNSTFALSSLLKNRAFGEWPQGQMSAVEGSAWSVLSFLLSSFAAQPKGLRIWTPGAGTGVGPNWTRECEIEICGRGQMRCSSALGHAC